MDEQLLKERAKHYLVCYYEPCGRQEHCLRWLAGPYVPPTDCVQTCMNVTNTDVVEGRKRTKPLLTGRTEIWAAAVVYTVGTMNFLFDKSFEPYISSADINNYFGTSSSTVAQKARTYGSCRNIQLGKTMGKAFSDGKQLK